MESEKSGISFGGCRSLSDEQSNTDDFQKKRTLSRLKELEIELVRLRDGTEDNLRQNSVEDFSPNATIDELSQTNIKELDQSDTTPTDFPHENCKNSSNPIWGLLIGAISYFVPIAFMMCFDNPRLSITTLLSEKSNLSQVLSQPTNVITLLVTVFALLLLLSFFLLTIPVQIRAWLDHDASGQTIITPSSPKSSSIKKKESSTRTLLMLQLIAFCLPAILLAIHSYNMPSHPSDSLKKLSNKETDIQSHYTQAYENSKYKSEDQLLSDNIHRIEHSRNSKDSSTELSREMEKEQVEVEVEVEANGLKSPSNHKQKLTRDLPQQQRQERPGDERETREAGIDLSGDFSTEETSTTGVDTANTVDTADIMRKARRGSDRSNTVERLHIEETEVKGKYKKQGKHTPGVTQDMPRASKTVAGVEGGGKIREKGREKMKSKGKLEEKKKREEEEKKKREEVEKKDGAAEVLDDNSEEIAAVEGELRGVISPTSSLTVCVWSGNPHHIWRPPSLSDRARPCVHMSISMSQDGQVEIQRAHDLTTHAEEITEKIVIDKTDTKQESSIVWRANVVSLWGRVSKSAAARAPRVGYSLLKDQVILYKIGNKGEWKQWKIGYVNNSYNREIGL